MSTFGKFLAGATAVVGGVVLCAIFPGAAAAVAKAAALAAPSVCEILDNGDSFPLV